MTDFTSILTFAGYLLKLFLLLPPQKGRQILVIYILQSQSQQSLEPWERSSAHSLNKPASKRSDRLGNITFLSFCLYKKIPGNKLIFLIRQVGSFTFTVYLIQEYAVIFFVFMLFLYPIFRYGEGEVVKVTLTLPIFHYQFRYRLKYFLDMFRQSTNLHSQDRAADTGYQVTQMISFQQLWHGLFTDVQNSFFSTTV